MFDMFNRYSKTGIPWGKFNQRHEDEGGHTSLPDDRSYASFVMKPLPSLRDVPSSERPALLRRKLGLCTVIYDFSDKTKNAKEKEMKQQTLLEILGYISSAGVGQINSHFVLEVFFRMISANIFRGLPFPITINTPSFPALDELLDELCLEPSWQHLQYVYECLLHYLDSKELNSKVAKRYIDQSFVLQLLDLFDTEDPREREHLKMVLHRIYSKFMVHRPFIRKAINNIFYRFVFESENHNGTGELLEILASIINGFALPLKEEHQLFLSKTLIPLHKPRSLASYHQQLSYCVVLFVERSPTLAVVVIRGLIKYWPLTNSQKEVLMLMELEEVLEVTHSAEFRTCMVPLFKKIEHSLTSMHYEVAERALRLWSNDHILQLIRQNYQVILPLVFRALEINSSHWNQSVLKLTQNVKKLFQNIDEEFFYRCQNAFHEEEAEAKVKEERREEAWKLLEAAKPIPFLLHV